jgi:hypothetical protein
MWNFSCRHLRERNRSRATFPLAFVFALSLNLIHFDLPSSFSVRMVPSTWRVKVSPSTLHRDINHRPIAIKDIYLREVGDS